MITNKEMDTINTSMKYLGLFFIFLTVSCMFVLFYPNRFCIYSSGGVSFIFLIAAFLNIANKI